MKENTSAAIFVMLAQHDKHGKFTGCLDKKLYKKMNKGLITKTEVLGLSHEKLLSKTSKISFCAKKNAIFEALQSA